MDSTTTEDRCAAPTDPTMPSAADKARTAATTAASVLAAATLAACGGGDDDDAPPGGGGVPPALPTAAEASRFLAQASMGASRAQIARVQAIGYAAWLDEQFALPPSTARWDALVAAGLNDISYKNTEAGFDPVTWAKLLASPDTLRQRVTLALSEIMVVAIDSLTGGGWKAFAAAAYLDLLEADAFGSHRALLQQVSLSTAMGDVPHLSRQRQGEPRHRRPARRELRPRADAAVHHRPGEARPRRQHRDRRRPPARPTPRTTSPAWPASSPAGTSTSPGRAPWSARRRPTSCAGR